ncbi:MAG: CRTAC1 family protein, partial [Planctomycetes bacterium]|nr:CRTAC1 family protein [Planctomycetota bacterium]
RVLQGLPDPMFRDVTAKLGLYFRHNASLDLAPRRSGLVLPVGLEGGGASAGDYDADGFPDLYLAGDGGGKLFRNDRGTRFVDASAAAGLFPEGETRAGYFIDFDSDGDLDLFATFVYRTNRLYRNEGEGRFLDVAEAVGLASGKDVTHEALWFDYDRDGLLDLYAAHFGPWPEGVGPVPREPNFNGGRNRLHHHRLEGGKHRFEEVAARLGVNEPGWTHCAGAWDYDQDGWLDLFSLDDFGPSYLFRNVGGRRFEDVTERVRVDGTFNAMNFALLDIEGDGHFAVYITQIMRRPRQPGDDLRRLVTNKLYARRPDGTYEDVHDRWIEPADLGWAWYAGALDYENDGDLDLLVLNGTEDSVPGTQGPASDRHAEGRMLVLRHAQQRNAFYASEDGYFYDVSAKCPVAFAGNSRGAAVFDLEGDGDLDVAVNDYEGPARVFENVQASGSSWVRLRLEGTRSNRSAIGARVAVFFGGQARHEQVVSATGFLSQSPQTLHFGLGKAALVDRAVIVWPSGRVQEVRDLPANQVHHVREPEG